MGSGELSSVNDILEQARSQVKVERRKRVFEGNSRLTSDDLKTPQDPEEFTKKF